MVRSSRPVPRRRRGLRQVLALLLLAMGVLLVPSSASAGPDWCEPTPAPTPVPPGFGGAALTGEPGAALNHLYESQLNEAYTAEELGSSGLYQQRGMVWHVIVTEDCLDSNRFAFWDAVYNPIWNFSLELNNLAAMAYMSVSADTFLASFEGLIVDMTAQLRDSLWRPLIPTMVIIGAVTLAYYAFIRQQSTLTFKGAVWMIIATALGMYMLFAPGQVLTLTSGFTTGANGLINQAVSAVTVNDQVSERCPGDAAQPQRSDAESTAMFTARQNGQMVWEGLMCRPWMAGLVGTSENAVEFSEEHGMDVLEATTITYPEMEDQGYVELVRDKRNLYENIADDLRGDDPDTTTKEYEVFSGNDGSHRLTVALGAALTALTGGLLILVASLALLGFKLAFVVGMLLAPVFLLIGIHPGRGRTVLLSWLGFMISLLLKQIVVMLMIGLLVLCLGLIMAMNLGLGMQSMLMLGLIIGLILAWKPLWSRFQSLGQVGDRIANSEPGAVRMPRFLSNLARNTMRAGAAVATGGSALAAVTGLPYAGKGRAGGAAARGLGRGAKTNRGQVPAGLRRREMNPRWGQVLDPSRATDGEGVQLRGNRMVDRVRDAAGVRPTSQEWRRENPVMAGWEAHRWAGMDGSARRAAVAEARRDPEQYMNRLREERNEWVGQVRKQKEGAPPPLTPHQQDRHARRQQKLDRRRRDVRERVQRGQDRWARRRVR